MEILKTLFKIALMLVGGLMVFGGGVCAASNLVFAVQMPPAIGILAVLFGVSVMTAWGGWWLVKFARGVGSKGSEQIDGAEDVVATEQNPPSPGGGNS